MSNKKPADILNLAQQLSSSDPDQRDAAARILGRLYAETGPTDPPLSVIASLVGAANDATADVAAPFIRNSRIRLLDRLMRPGKTRPGHF